MAHSWQYPDCSVVVVTLLEQCVTMTEGDKFNTSCLLPLLFNPVSLRVYRQ